MGLSPADFDSAIDFVICPCSLRESVGFTVITKGVGWNPSKGKNINREVERNVPGRDIEV